MTAVGILASEPLRERSFGAVSAALPRPLCGTKLSSHSFSAVFPLVALTRRAVASDDGV